MTQLAEDILPNINSMQAAERGKMSFHFCPSMVTLTLTLTFKLVRAKDKTRLPCEFGGNPFSGSCHLLWNANPKKEGVSPISTDFARCHGNVPDQSRNQYQIEHLHQHVYHL